MVRQRGVGFDTLLERARAGNEAAWADLYDSLAPQLLGYLRARGAVDADEVLGEVFLHVARGIDDFEGDMAGFRSWVFVIATSRLHDEQRRRRRKPTSPLEPTAAEHLTSAVDVQMEVERASVAAEVQSLLCVLTCDQRAVVELRIFGGLTSQEVADALGKPLGAVKALYRRGLRAMRRELEGEPAAARAGSGSSATDDRPGAARVLPFPAPAVPLRAAAAVTRGS